MDQMWHTLIIQSLDTTPAPQVSLATLAGMHNKLSKTVSAHTIQNTELDHQITKLATRMGDLKSSEQETKYRDLEYEIRIHGINTLGIGTPNHFRNLSYPNKIKAVHEFVESHLDTKNACFSTQIHSPKQGARHFETLVIVRFTHTDTKFEFERNFANYRKNTPGCTISTSRPNPQKTSTDRDMPNIPDVRQKIGMLYNAKITATKLAHPQSTFTPLNPDQIENLQCTIKTKTRPFKVYIEFLDPSNGTTFCHYDLNKDPFNEHDFTQEIPNPLTRKHAAADASYRKIFQPRVFKK